jgi:polar amino acid transport system permease protein
MEWDWEFVRQIMPTLIAGVKITILATILGSALAAVVGLAIAVARRSSNKALARGVGFAAEFIRGTPLLVQLYFIFYVLPDIGILLPPLVAGVIGLGLHYGTYAAEVYRAGIDNVPSGQWEAAKACNLSTPQTWTRIILPNYFIAMFKETPLLSAITVLELMNQAKSVANSYYRYVEPMTLVGAFFLAISLASVILLRWFERRYGRIER